MGRRIELPQLPKGQPQEQLQALYSYLYQMAEALNNNLAEIGNGDFTDDEMTVVREIVGADGTADSGRAEAETLKSLIIKTAQLIKSEIDQYNMKLIGTYEADGKLGRYVRKTRLDVDVTPSGIQQNYTFAEIIQGLKTYEVNAKNYIKTGYLRTESSIPVYGVAIGKDVVTFASDGTETYNDGNKVAELTADELSFWQNQNKVASYTGNKISFYYGNTEAFYIQNGKIYAAGDMELATGKTLKVKSGGTLQVESGGNIDINATGNLKLSGSTVEIKSGSTFDLDSENLEIDSTPGTFKVIRDRGSGQKTFFSFGLDSAYITPALGEAWINENVQGLREHNVRTYPLVFRSIDRLSEPGKRHETWMYFGPWCDDNEGTIVSGLNCTHGAFNEGEDVGSGSFQINCKKIKCGYVDADHNIKSDTVYYRFLEQISSRDIKHDIQDMESRGEQLDRLRPVTFVYDDDPAEKTRTGLIYEETKPVMPEICTGDEGDKAISYMELVPMLLKEIQDLRARVKALEER